MSNSLSKVQEFWDETPCDGQASYGLRAQFRYGKDPYLLAIIERIAAAHRNVLEVGCGQGTDGVTLCQRMPSDGRYYGVDLSEVSLESARQSAQDAGHQIKVQPTFEFANAEELPFKDDSFDCVLSVGALHHTPDTARALAEVRRVLAPGGTAYVLLYRTASPKLLVAHALRGLQAGLDAVLGQDRILYRASRALRPLEPRIGTAVYECLGVPILRSYTRRGVEALFSDYTLTHVDPYGPFPSFVLPQSRKLLPSALGYLWLVQALK